ncbi:MAG: hypothetical protein AAB605_04450 [Patescibacteria group bacterium]
MGEACEGKGLEGKPKEMPKEGGGMPPMLPMPPMGMPKPDMPMPPEQNDECRKHPTSTECRSLGGQGGVSGLLNSWFGADTLGTGGTLQNTAQSVADKLWSFITGGDTSESTQTSSSQSGASTQTNTSNSPFSTSNVTTGGSVQLNAQAGGAQAQAGQGSSFSGGQTVTGFDADASADGGSPGFWDIVGQILSGVEIILQEMLAGLL